MQQGAFNPEYEQPKLAAAVQSVRDHYERVDAAARLEVEAMAGSTVGALEKMFNSPPISNTEDNTMSNENKDFFTEGKTAQESRALDSDSDSGRLVPRDFEKEVKATSAKWGGIRSGITPVSAELLRDSPSNDAVLDEAYRKRLGRE